MNILTDRLPTAIRVNSRIYEVNSDFRDCLRIILAFEDNELTASEKSVIVLDSLYQERPADEDLREALRQGVRFLNGGDDESSDQDISDGLRLFSFAKDARFIFAAFQQTHGIDLQNTQYLHWWQFMTLFMDLGADTLFCNLVGLRKRVKTGKASKEERKVAREMGEVFSVPEIDTRTLDEKEREREFMRLIEEARQAKKEKVS